MIRKKHMSVSLSMLIASNHNRDDTQFPQQLATYDSFICISYHHSYDLGIPFILMS